MIWKGTAWPWVGGGRRRDDFQTSSIQPAAGRLRQAAWLLLSFLSWVHVCWLCLLCSSFGFSFSSLAVSVTHCFFFLLITLYYSVSVLFPNLSSPALPGWSPCPCTSYFCFYSIALQLLWDASSLKSRAMLCVPPCLQKQAQGIISRRCTVRGVQCLKTPRLLRGSAAMEAGVVERLMYTVDHSFSTSLPIMPPLTNECGIPSMPSEPF